MTNPNALQSGQILTVNDNRWNQDALQSQRSRPFNRLDNNCRKFRRTYGDELESLQQMLLTSREQFVSKAYSILGNKEDAEDAVQNAFLSAYLHIRSFEGRSALRTWFTRIVMNAALMIRRKRKSSRFVPLADPDAEGVAFWQQIPSEEPDPEKAYAAQETLQRIETQLARMRPPLRQALVMTYHELSHDEACALLGISLSAFKARLLRARRQMAKRVSLRNILRLSPRAPKTSQTSQACIAQASFLG